MALPLQVPMTAGRLFGKRPRPWSGQRQLRRLCREADIWVLNDKPLRAVPMPQSGRNYCQARARAIRKLHDRPLRAA